MGKKVIKLTEEITITRAITECFNFNPDNKVEAEIIFEAAYSGFDSLEEADANNENVPICFFGKQWNEKKNKWEYFTASPSFAHDITDRNNRLTAGIDESNFVYFLFYENPLSKTVSNITRIPYSHIYRIELVDEEEKNWFYTI